MNRQEELLLAMMEYDKSMPKQIQHLMKVHYFAHIIATMEGVDNKTTETLETAAILHDIGIREALKKYGSSAGKYQEELGPAEAEPIMEKLGYEKETIDRVKYLIGHHHTYSHIDGIDYQILVEADFLVNLFEDNEPEHVAKTVEEKIFKTAAGKKLLETMFHGTSECGKDRKAEI